MTDTVSGNPLLQNASFSSPQLPAPAFANIINKQGVQNQASLITSQAGAARETQEAGIASAALERALANLAQKRQEFQAAQADRVNAEADAAAAQRELTQAQSNLSSAQGQLQAAQAALEKARRDAEEMTRSKVQQQVVQPVQQSMPQAPQKDWSQDPEYRELYRYFISDYTPRQWRAEEEALRQINRQMMARGNRMGDTTGVDTARIRQEVGARFGVDISGGFSSDPKIQRYYELQRQAGGPPSIGYDQSADLKAYDDWKAKSGGDWRDWWDTSRPKPPSAGVGKF